MPKDAEFERTDFQKIIHPLIRLICEDTVALEKWYHVKDALVQDSAEDRCIFRDIPATHNFSQGIQLTLKLWAENKGEKVANLSNFIRILREHQLNAIADRATETWPDLISRSKPIIELVGRDGVQIHTQILEEVLSKAGERPLAIYSINGKKRGGKSFMLNQFLKYLEFGCTNPTDWIEQLLPKSFIWRGGERRVTSGIQVWSDVYIVQVGGQEVAVLLLDVQGLFDEQTEMKRNALVFAYSTLLSSVNIFNTKDMGEDTLQFLHAFIECAKVGLTEDGDGVPAFQNLILLIRDYANDREFGLGLHNDQSCPRNENGEFKNLKNYYFDGVDEVELSKQAKESRRAIKACFQKVSVATLPYPGLALTRRDDENTCSWDPDFKRNVVEFVEGLFSPEAIEGNIKLVGGKPMTGNKLLDFALVWADLYKNPERLPDFKSVLEATADVQWRQHVKNALAVYRTGIDDLVRINPQGIDPETFENHHGNLTASSIITLQSAHGIGGVNSQNSFLELLRAEICELQLHYMELNKNNLRGAARLEHEEGRRRSLEAALAKEREERCAAEANAAQKRLSMAEMQLQDARQELARAHAQNVAVHANRDSYYDVQVIHSKHRRRLAGLVFSPYYTTDTVKLFNQEKFDEAIEMSTQEIRRAEEKVQLAENKLQALQMHL